MIMTWRHVIGQTLSVRIMDTWQRPIASAICARIGVMWQLLIGDWLWVVGGMRIEKNREVW